MTTLLDDQLLAQSFNPRGQVSTASAPVSSGYGPLECRDQHCELDEVYWCPNGTSSRSGRTWWWCYEHERIHSVQVAANNTSVVAHGTRWPGAVDNGWIQPVLDARHCPRCGITYCRDCDPPCGEARSIISSDGYCHNCAGVGIH